MNIKKTLGIYILSAILFAIVAFAFQQFVYKLGNATTLGVGGFTFTWKILGDALTTVVPLALYGMFLILLAFILIFYAQQIPIPVRLFLTVLIIMSLVVGTYIYAFEAGVKTNIEAEVKNWCYDNNLLCKQNCLSWQQEIWIKGFDKNYIPNR